jgi:general secretion pathway protein J
MNWQRGFTLLELLIGLTLLGFIMVLLFGGLRLGSRSWDTGEQRLESSSQFVVAQGFLRRQLSQIQPMRWKTVADNPVAFVGEAHALRFSGSLSSQFGLAGIYLIILEEENGEAGTSLVMRWHRPSHDDKDFSVAEEGEKTVLAKNIKDLAFAYFGAESDQKEPVWHDDWQSAERLPSLIRLRLTLESGETWPEMVVAPMVSTESACLWDDFFKRCVDRPQ